MSNASKRVEGKVVELGGKAEGAIGSLIGNEQMQAEGFVQELEGQAIQAAAKAKERIKGAAQEFVGKAKHAVGALVGNEQAQLEGKAKELEGKARQAGNR